MNERSRRAKYNSASSERTAEADGCAESGLYYYGARYHDPRMRRFLSVDPLADWAPSWTPYRYGFNNPVNYIDPDGLFEDKASAKQHAKDNDIRTGWFSRNRIGKQDDGSYAIENGVDHSLTYDAGGDIGVVTAVVVAANDEMSREFGWFSDDVTLRDGSVVNEEHMHIGFPAGSAIGAGGAVLSSMGIGPKLIKGGKKAIDYMKGGKKSVKDRNFGIKDIGFWKWWHKQKGKMKGTGRGKDIKSKKQADELYDKYKTTLRR